MADPPPAKDVPNSLSYPPDSGWTVDTLRDALLRLIEDQGALLTRILEERDRRHEQRFDAQIAAATEADRRYAQRFDAIVHAAQEADKRYEQRYVGQEGAVQAALAAQEKAVNAALLAADRAVSKAETASEKRFEGVNEFRGQLADQAANLMPRGEAEARFQSTAEKLSEAASLSRDQIDRLRQEIVNARDEVTKATTTNRDEFQKAVAGLRDEFQKGLASLMQTQSLSSGKSTGYSQAWTVAVAVLGAVLGIGGLALAVLK